MRPAGFFHPILVGGGEDLALGDDFRFPLGTESDGGGGTCIGDGIR